MDKILIRDLRIYARHGVFEEEKHLGQPFFLDMTLYLDLAPAASSDDVEYTVNYAQVIALAQRVLQARNYNLLERCAQILADEINRTFPAIRRIDIVLKKPHAAIDADFGYVAVEISRSF